MNKKVQTYYTWEIKPPQKSGKYTVKDKYGKINSDSYIIGRGDLQDALWKQQGIKWLSEQQGVLLSVEEWENIKVKDDIIRSLEQQIQQANEKLDQIGAPSVSAYGNQLTILGRLDGCVYIESALQPNKQLPNATTPIQEESEDEMSQEKILEIISDSDMSYAERAAYIYNLIKRKV